MENEQSAEARETHAEPPEASSASSAPGRPGARLDIHAIENAVIRKLATLLLELADMSDP